MRAAISLVSVGEQDLDHVGRVGDHEDHHLGFARHLGRGVADHCSGLDDRGWQFGAMPHHGEGVAGGLEMPRHWAAHDAKPDKPYVHPRILPVGSRRLAAKRGPRKGSPRFPPPFGAPAAGRVVDARPERRDHAGQRRCARGQADETEPPLWCEYAPRFGDQGAAFVGAQKVEDIARNEAIRGAV